MKEKTAWGLFHKYSRADQDGGLHFLWSLEQLLFSPEKRKRSGSHDVMLGEFLRSWNEKEAIELIETAFKRRHTFKQQEAAR